MADKCFCHIRNKATGEIYVVKDKEARELINNINLKVEEDIDAAFAEANNMNITLTVSDDAAQASEAVKAYLV